MVTVFNHARTETELVVTCSRLEYGESIYIILVPACQSMLHDEVYIADNVNGDDDGSSEMEDVLAYSINEGFRNIESFYAVANR